MEKYSKKFCRSERLHNRLPTILYLFQENFKLIEIDLSKKQALDVN